MAILHGTQVEIPVLIARRILVTLCAPARSNPGCASARYVSFEIKQPNAPSAVPSRPLEDEDTSDQNRQAPAMRPNPISPPAPHRCRSSAACVDTEAYG